MRFLYQRALKPVLFRMDPEKVHEIFIGMGSLLGRTSVGRGLVSLPYGYRGPDASVTVDGLTYRTPLLLAAGFDYNGRLTGILRSVGFGGVEVGSVTARPCAGNPGPRLGRLPKSKSLLVNKGLRNDGVEVIAKRLKRVPPSQDFILGVSIARTNDEKAASLTGGIDDFRISLAHLVAKNVGHYYTLNISCPNLYGGEDFSEEKNLRELLTALADIRHDRPVYAKMPINRSWEEFNKLLRLVDWFGLNGVIIGNLNKNYDELDHPEEAPEKYRGGISGDPCFERSTELVQKTRATYGDRFTIMGCGGTLSVDQARAKFEAGADLVQMLTGMIFNGPHLIKEIARDYAERKSEFVTP